MSALSHVVRLAGASSALGLMAHAPAHAQEGSAPVAVGYQQGIQRIVVVGKRQDISTIPGAATVLDAETLELFNYDDVLRALRLVPGINLQEEDGYGLRPNIGLRGTPVERSEKITLMEDGVLIAPAPYAAPAAYYFPSVGRMSAVEVRKGSSAVKFGPRTGGGAINLISTPVPDSLGGKVNTRLGTDGLYQLHAYAGGPLATLGNGSTISVLLETYQSGADGFKQLDGGGETGFEVEDYVGKLRWKSGPDAAMPQVFEIKAAYYDQQSDETYLGLTDEDFAATPYRRYAASQNDRMDADHKQLQAVYSIEPASNIDVTVLAYYNAFSRDWFKLDDLNLGDGRGRISPSVLFGDPTNPLNAAGLAILRGEADSADGALQLRHNARTYYSWGVQAIAGVAFETGPLAHDLEISVRYHEDEEDRLQFRENFAMRSGTLVRTSVDPLGSQGNREAKGEAWAFYVQDEIEAGPFRIVPGLRVEQVRLTRLDYATSDPARINGPTNVRAEELTTFSPGLGVIYDINAEWHVLLGAFRGTSPPAPGDGAAREERSDNVEFGVRYDGDRIRSEVIGFFTGYDNLLGTCSNASGCGAGEIGDQFNGGKVDVYGLEASAEASIPLTGGLELPLRAAYTFTDAEFKSSFSDAFWGTVTQGDKLPYIPRHQLTAAAGLAGETWSATLLANYVSAVRAEPSRGSIPANERIGSRVVFDIAGDVELNDAVQLFAKVENLFDKAYAVARRPYGLRPGKPITATVGLGVTF